MKWTEAQTLQLTTEFHLKNYTILENNKRPTWPLVWWWVLTQQKKPTYPIRNIHYFKHWLLQFYTFTLRRTFFQRTKRHSVKWTSDHPPLPGNGEEKTPSGVILQQEVLVRNKELTSSHEPGFCRGQQEVNKRWETAVQRFKQLPSSNKDPA